MMRGLGGGAGWWEVIAQGRLMLVFFRMDREGCLELGAQNWGGTCSETIEHAERDPDLETCLLSVEDPELAPSSLPVEHV